MVYIARMFFGVAFVCAGVIGGTRVNTTSSLRQRISPALSPKSDETFFGKDYPDDLRPMDKIPFKAPFPTLQKSSTYDEDFVNDENNDNGEWKAQMNYDNLRVKLKTEKEESEVAKNNKAADKDALGEATTAEDAAWSEHEKAKAAHADALKRLEDAKKKAKDALDKASKEEEQHISEAEKKAKDATDREKAAEENAARVEAEPVKPLPIDQQVANGKKLVEDKIKNLADCKQQLEDAQKQLADLLEKQKEDGKKQGESKESAVSEAKGEVDKAKKEEQDATASATNAHAEAEAEHEKLAGEADAATKEAQAALEEAEKNLRAANEALDSEAQKAKEAAQKHEQAAKSYKKEQEDVKNTEDDLKRAEETLRKHRHAGKGKTTEKSGASMFTISLLVAGVLVIGLWR